MVTEPSLLHKYTVDKLLKETQVLAEFNSLFEASVYFLRTNSVNMSITLKCHRFTKLMDPNIKLRRPIAIAYQESVRLRSNNRQPGISGYLKSIYSGAL